jgi:prevent-host-death family protein
MPKRSPAADLTTFSHMRQNLRACLDRMKKSGRPVFVTTNGKPEAVVLTADAYERLLRDPQLSRSVASVSRGLQEIAEGKGKNIDDAMLAIRRPARSGRRKSA